MSWMEKGPNGLPSQSELREELQTHLGQIALGEKITREEVEAILLQRINENFNVSYKNISQITGKCLREVLEGVKKYLNETKSQQKIKEEIL